MVYKKKLIYVVMGGIGNQLFQYANAFALSKKYNIDFFPEKNFAIISNIKFNRKFKLNLVIYKISELNILVRLKVLLFFLFRKIKVNIFFKFIYENNHTKYEKILLDNNNVILLGYWQSENYFINYSSEISKQIQLPTNGSKIFNNFFNLIQNTNSVAICIRVYDELSGDKSFVGGEENADFYNKSIKLLEKKIKNPVYFIFSQKKYPIFNKIKIKSKKYYITSENIDFDELSNLSLIVKCKHHIISNSSYYWWGAWLSEKRNVSKTIYASSKFSNLDAIPERWNKI